MGDGWKIDAVLAGLLSEEERGQVRHAADALPDGLIHGDRGGNIGMPTVLPERGIHLHVDRRRGERFVGGSALLQAQVRYGSRRDQTCCLMGIDGPEGRRRIDFAPHLTVGGALAPGVVVDALKGRHATAVIDHPALRLEGLVATTRYVNTRGDEAIGFGVLLPQILSPL